MDNKKRLPIVVFLLLIACGNFMRLSGNDNIRPIQYISLLAIGGLFSILIQVIFSMIKSKNKQ
jgi:hypothetical protein